MVVFHSSTIPASLYVVSNVQGRAVSVTENVVAVSVILEDGVTLLPDQVKTSAPYTSLTSTEVICWVVVVVLFIDPVVNWGVTVLALATAGDNRAKRRINFFIVLVFLLFCFYHCQ